MNASPSGPVALAKAEYEPASKLRHDVTEPGRLSGGIGYIQSKETGAP